MAARPTTRTKRRTRTPDDQSLHVLRSGWPSGVALLDEQSLVELEALSDDPSAGALAVLVCEFADVAIDAGELVAKGMLGSAGRDDFHSCSPAGERWTVGEVEDLAFVLRRYPAQRHVVLLTDADRLDRRALDRFLVMLEEPPSPLLVLMCVPRLDVLPGTIRGRASVVLELGVLPAPARVHALTEQDVLETIAIEAVALAGIRPSLAGPLAADAPLRNLAKKCFEPGLADRAPVLDGYHRLAAMTTLAGVLAEVRAAPGSAVELRERSLEDLSPAGRAMLREVLVVWGDHRRRALLAMLPTLDAQEVEYLERCLCALEVFQERLRVPVSAGLCMAALVTLSPARHDDRAQLT